MGPVEVIGSLSSKTVLILGVPITTIGRICGKVNFLDIFATWSELGGEVEIIFFLIFLFLV